MDYFTKRVFLRTRKIPLHGIAVSSKSEIRIPNYTSDSNNFRKPWRNQPDRNFVTRAQSFVCLNQNPGLADVHRRSQKNISILSSFQLNVDLDSRRATSHDS